MAKLLPPPANKHSQPDGSARQRFWLVPKDKKRVCGLSEQMRCALYLPEGSWQQTGRAAKMYLSAELRRRDGSYVKCQTEIENGQAYENIDGQLQTMENGDGPDCDWSHSARNATLTVHAQLQRCNGTWANARISFIPGQKFENINGTFRLDADDSTPRKRKFYHIAGA